MWTHIKEISKSALLAFCEGNSPVTDEFPAKGPVTRKKLPFGDVIMYPRYDTQMWLNNIDFCQYGRNDIIAIVIVLYIWAPYCDIAHHLWFVLLRYDGL